MKTQNNNISPEIIDLYMQKGKQERSDAIFYSFKWLTCSIKLAFTMFKMTRKHESDNAGVAKDYSKGDCKTA